MPLILAYFQHSGESNALLNSQSIKDFFHFYHKPWRRDVYGLGSEVKNNFSELKLQDIRSIGIYIYVLDHFTSFDISYICALLVKNMSSFLKIYLTF